MTTDQTPLSLEKELETFNKHKADLLKDAGKFALVHGDSLAGIYDTYADAIREGYKQFGLKAFLVKQIQQFDQVSFITRNVTPECHISPLASPSLAR